MGIVRIIGEAGKDITVGPKVSSGKELHRQMSKFDSMEIN